MLEHGSNNSLPAKYRIALALSTAFLIHTLLLSSVPSIVEPPPVQHRQQLNLELIATKNSHSTTPAYAPHSGEKSTQRNPRFEVAPDPDDSQSMEPALSTTHSEQKRANSKGQHTPETQKKTDQPQPTAPARASSSPSTSANDTQFAEKDKSEKITRITQSPTEQDPYLVKLAMHLAAQLETLRIPAIRTLTDTSTMKLELHLLGNGALTRVRVITSTGVELIDNAAYRAALSASPYPEPPPDQGDKSRFEVKLVFAPSRL